MGKIKTEGICQDRVPGQIPRFPAAGPLALRLAAECCDSVPATASQIWAGCCAIHSQSEHVQSQITLLLANSQYGTAESYPSQM